MQWSAAYTHPRSGRSSEAAALAFDLCAKESWKARRKRLEEEVPTSASH